MGGLFIRCLKIVEMVTEEFMDVHIQQSLTACVDALSHIRRGLDDGELEWAQALAESTLQTLYGLRREMSVPADTMRQGLWTGLQMRDPMPVRGRLLNVAVGLSLGWLIGHAKLHPQLQEIEHFINHLEGLHQTICTQRKLNID